MSSKDKKSYPRSPEMTQISISLPKRLLNKVDRLAKLVNRSRSNYIAYILERLPEDAIPSSPNSFLQTDDSYPVAAEPTSEFSQKNIHK